MVENCSLTGSSTPRRKWSIMDVTGTVTTVNSLVGTNLTKRARNLWQSYLKKQLKATTDTYATKTIAWWKCMNVNGARWRKLIVNCSDLLALESDEFWIRLRSWAQSELWASCDMCSIFTNTKASRKVNTPLCCKLDNMFRSVRIVRSVNMAVGPYRVVYGPWIALHGDFLVGWSYGLSIRAYLR